MPRESLTPVRQKVLAVGGAVLLEGRLHRDEHETGHLLHLGGQLRRGLARNARGDLGDVLVRLAQLEGLEDLPNLLMRDLPWVGDALAMKLLHHLVDDVLADFHVFLCLYLLQPLVEVVDALFDAKGGAARRA